MSDQETEKKKPLSVIRLIVAAIGVLLMTVSGGCTLALGIPFLFGGGGDPFSALVLVMMFGGIPFGIGLLMFRTATKQSGGGKTES